MGVDRNSGRIAHVLVAPRLVDADVVDRCDAAVEGGAQELVIDLSGVTELDGEAVVLLAGLSLKLEDAGGKLSLTARRPPAGARATRRLWTGDLSSALGVHQALDQAILDQLTAGAGRAAPK